MGLLDKQRIHETVIKDILDLMHDVKDSDEVKMIQNRDNGKSIKSIADASSNLTLVFPVLCSNSIGIETASMITKAVERKCVTMMQLLLSACSTAEAGENAFDYLATFHTNMKGAMTVDDYVDAMEQITDESAQPIFSPEVIRTIKEDMHCLDYRLDESINERSLLDYKVNDSNAMHRFQVTLEASPKNDQVFRYSSHDAKNVMDASDKNTSYFTKQLFDNDVKKCNELVPTLMVVRFMTPDTKCMIRQFVIGIKAKLISMDSYDICDRIKVKNDDHKGLLKFLRATTREISFFKDFLLAVDRAKLDALAYSRNSSNSSIWKMLERRSIKGNLRKGFQMKNDATRIATLVISQEEVEYLKKDGVDIDSGKIAKVIMDAYGLLGFVITNDSMEVARFLWDDGSQIYEDISYRNLERESSESEYRKIINLMSKMR